MLRYLLYYLLLANLTAYLLCFLDKRAAIKKRWRISENTLLASAILGGAAGLYLGMKTFRHKTKHLKFTALVPLILLIQVAGLVWFQIRYL
jgi:uncharacterized membrane protein YsdA (DUF1294 family)